MPISHAALKQLKKDKRRNARNAAIKSELRTVSKRFLAALQEQKIDEAQTLLRAVAKKYDQAASRNLIHRNTAARKKSRFSQQLSRVSPA